MRLCGHWFAMRAAVLIEDPSGATVRVSGTCGIGRSQRARLNEQIGSRHNDAVAAQLRQAVRAFERVTGAQHVSTVRAGHATVLAADVSFADRGSFRDVAALLGASLERIEREAQREHDLDLGLAMTAHELRGPLLGARVALDQVVRGGGAGHLPLLRQTERELAELSAKVDALLRWSVGASSLHLARTDLVRIVRDAVRACMVEDGQLRVDLKGSARIAVMADAVHLRSAIENVVRNALAYSPMGSRVDVRTYVTKAGRATVAIRDRGPGIPAHERAAVFDPLTRGGAGAMTAGNGLGLFVAKRVMDAHGGDVSFRPAADGVGTVFRLRLLERRP